MGAMAEPEQDDVTPEPLSDRLQAWLEADGVKSLGALVSTFGPQSFAILFVVLMAFPALPLPTGGVSHVLEIATMLLALTAAAFLAPPFSGLDTLPSLGIVVLSLGVLLGDIIVAIVGIVLGAVGVGLVFVLGSAVLHFL